MGALARFLFENGIGQNLTASVLMGVPAAIWAKVKVLPHVRAHIDRVRDTHAKTVELHQHHLPHLWWDDDEETKP